MPHCLPTLSAELVICLSNNKCCHVLSLYILLFALCILLFTHLTHQNGVDVLQLTVKCVKNSKIMQVGALMDVKQKHSDTLKGFNNATLWEVLSSIKNTRWKKALGCLYDNFQFVGFGHA